LRPIRLPSRCRPVSSSSTASTTPTLRQLSAMLKTANFSPYGPNTLIMSTTCPRNGPGARNSRSMKLPSAPPSTRPSAMPQGTERSLRAIHPIHPITTSVITGNTQV
jgi:hypothetical protein